MTGTNRNGSILGSNGALTAEVNGKNTMFARFPRELDTKDNRRHEHLANVANRGVELAQRADSYAAELNADVDLSDVGRGKNARAALDAINAELGQLDEAVAEHTAAVEQDEKQVRSENVQPRDPTDAAGMQLDIAIAQKVASMDEVAVAQKIEGGSFPSEVNQALARLPGFVSGITDEQRGKANSHAADPEKLAAVETDKEAVEATQNALSKARNSLTSLTSLARGSA